MTPKTTPGRKPCAVYLLTTCHVGNDGIADLLRLIGSVGAAVDGGEVDKLRVLALLQGCSATEREDVQRRIPDWVDLVVTEASLSSPAARNVLIQQLLQNAEFDPAAVVAFPDDDAWYPPGTWSCVVGHFSDSSDLQLLLTRYGPAPSARQCTEAFRPTLQQALSRGACAAIFVRAGLLVELGGFHELLGLGTELRGGEDTDFVHRAFHRGGRQVLCVHGFLVGHAESDPAKKGRYYEGGLAAIMAHSRVSPAARMALARKLAVGAWLVVRNRLPLADYFSAMRKARTHSAAIRAGPASSKMG